jgi:hypothetical protein
MENVSKEGKYYSFFNNSNTGKHMIYIEGLFCFKGLCRDLISRITSRSVYSYENINHYDQDRYSSEMTYEIMA